MGSATRETDCFPWVSWSLIVRWSLQRRDNKKWNCSREESGNREGSKKFGSEEEGTSMFQFPSISFVRAKIRMSMPGWYALYMDIMVQSAVSHYHRMENDYSQFLRGNSLFGTPRFKGVSQTAVTRIGIRRNMQQIDHLSALIHLRD